MKQLYGIFLAILFAGVVSAQEGSMLDLIGSEEETEPIEYTEASFKTTRVVNSHSLENVAPGVLDFKISHRFGFLNTGAYELFGLDQASIRLGLDYGISERFMIGVGRSSFEKTYDGYAKYKILRQSSGGRNMPVTLAVMSAMTINTLRWEDPDRENYFSSRLTYTHQIIVGRKFSEGFSAQLMPSLVHRNLVATRDEANDVLAIGGAARQKLTNRLSINAEYYYVAPDQIASNFHNSLSVGFDIETGGHVFQLHFTNSTAMIEKGFITETTGDWLDGDIHFGFNISRVFTIVKPKEFKEAAADDW